MIDKISNLNKITQAPKTESVRKPAAMDMGSDSISISPEAQKAAEVSSIARNIKTSVDESRLERIKDIKLRLQNGEYDQMSAEMLNKIAARITPALLRAE